MRLSFGYATAISILKAAPLQFPSENGTGYYLPEKNLNDPSPGRESNFLPEYRGKVVFCWEGGREECFNLDL